MYEGRKGGASCLGRCKTDVSREMLRGGGRVL